MVFWLKNPGSVNDDFWSIFIGLWTVISSLVWNAVSGLLPLKQSLFYYACADIDPVGDQKLRKNYFIMLEVLFVASIHALTITRIKIFKKKSASVIPSSTNAFTSQAPVSTIVKESLSDTAVNTGFIIFATIYVLLQSKVGSFTMAGANRYPNYLYMYAYHFFGPASINFVVSLGYYIRHPKLTKKSIFELKKCFWT